MAIFNFENNTKTEFDKIGVNTIRPFKKNGRWVFNKDNKTWDLAPAQLTDASLSPIVLGADKLISNGCKAKNIQNPENGFLILFSEQWFPGCDVKLIFKENKFDGWLYDVESQNLQELMPGQGAWLCPYIKMYYENPPQNLYLKIEENND
jgi:hypothetical protein